jgi:hypothetical protein
MEALPGPWRLILESWRLTLEHCRLTMKHCRLTLEPFDSVWSSGGSVWSSGGSVWSWSSHFSSASDRPSSDGSNKQSHSVRGEKANFMSPWPPFFLVLSLSSHSVCHYWGRFVVTFSAVGRPGSQPPGGSSLPVGVLPPRRHRHNRFHRLVSLAT